MSSILVYSRTAGYRHESIPTAIDTLSSLGRANNYTTIFTEDPAAFNDTYLSTFTALCFLMNSDEILDSTAQRLALWSYLHSGGALIGIHSANAALFDEPFFGTAMGAFFNYHPNLQPAQFLVENASFAATNHLPEPWTFEEEVYNYRSDPLATNVTVLLTANTSSYVDPNFPSNYGYYQGSPPHPIAWIRDAPVDLGNNTGTNGMNASLGDVIEQGSFPANGRMFYTSLGHLSSTWQNETFQQHINGGILWALGMNNATNISYANATQAVDSSSAAEPRHAGLIIVLASLFLPFLMHMRKL